MERKDLESARLNSSLRKRVQKKAILVKMSSRMAVGETTLHMLEEMHFYDIILHSQTTLWIFPSSQRDNADRLDRAVQIKSRAF
jgi:hypothetical protein